MGKSLWIGAMIVTLLVLSSTNAHATAPLGPFCFSTLPFSNVFVWFLDAHGGNQFDGTGRDFFANRAQTVTGFVTGSEFRVNFVTSPGTTGNPVMGGGTINTSSGTGPGRCHTVNSALGCGTGTDFTFALTTCPAGALTIPETVSEGPLMDGSE